MIKRYDVTEIPKELYSEGYKYLDFEVMCDKDGVLNPLNLKLVSDRDESYIIDNLHTNKEAIKMIWRKKTIMCDFLKSITFMPGPGRTREQTMHDFNFIKDYYGLHRKIIHDRAIFRFVEKEQLHEEEKDD